MSSSECESQDTLLPTAIPASSPPRRSRNSISQQPVLATVTLLVVLLAGYLFAVGDSTSKWDSPPDHLPTLRFPPRDSPAYTPPSTYDLTPSYDPYDYTPSYDYPPGGYNSSGCPRDQFTNGYTRSDGTYVRGYYHNSPSDSCGGG